MAVAFLVLGACATTAPDGAWSPVTASRVRTVALLDIAEPAVDLVLNRGDSNESHSSSYAQALTTGQIVFSPLLAEAITRQLDRSNYQVLPLAERPVVAADGSVDLSGIRTDADAILVVRFIKAGYVSDSTSDLQPWAIVEVQLFDSRTRRALYSKTFNGGYDTGAAGLIQLATQPRFRFESVEQLTDRLDDSAGGIKDAELAIAGAMGRDFAIGSRPVVSESSLAEAPPSPPVSADERDRQTAAVLAAQWTEAMPRAPVVPPDAATPATGEATSATPVADIDGQATAPDTTAAAPTAMTQPEESAQPAVDRDATQAIPMPEAVEQPMTAPAQAAASAADIGMPAPTAEAAPRVETTPAADISDAVPTAPVGTAPDIAPAIAAPAATTPARTNP
ncbi:MAG TPA: hypothetical protein VFM56_01670, partial [Solimonas sp.]|nr:hypothetical protein [Solimonas sp.]